MKKLLSGILLLCLLQACNSNEPEAQNPLIFSETNPSIFIDNIGFVNDVSGGSGSGALSWSSSDTDIATVDSMSGVVTPKDNGSVVITVTKEADENFLPVTASYQLTIEKYQREAIAFRVAELLLPVTGPTVENPILGIPEDGLDTLNVEFSSSDTEVAEVGVESGEVTIVSKGDTVISAFIPESHLFYQTTISYDLSVRAFIENVQVDMSQDWVRVNWETIDTPVALILANSANCSQAAITTCVNAVSTSLNADSPQSLSFSNYDIDAELFITIETDSYSSTAMLVEKQEPPFKQRKGGRFVNFNNELLFIGGFQDDTHLTDGLGFQWFNDVWSSADGVNWTLKTANAAFTPRSNFQLVAYQGHLYLIGGEEGFGNGGGFYYKADVWRSSDGINWELLNGFAPFYGGTTGEAIVFNDKIFVIGGGAFYRSAILYSSTDGVSWTIENDSPPFDNIEEHELFVWNEKLFLIGGFSSPGSDNPNKSIYSTADGKSWQKEGQLPENLTFLKTTVVPYGDELLMIGGVRAILWGAHNSVYRSTDGVDWSLVTSDAIVDLGYDHEVFKLNDKLSIYAFEEQTLPWFSDDGAQWYLNSHLSITWQLK